MAERTDSDDPLDPDPDEPGERGREDARAGAGSSATVDAPDEETAAVDLAALPGLARIAVGVGLRTASLSVGSAYGATRRLARAARSGESPTELIDEIADELVQTTKRVLGIEDDAFPVNPPERSESSHLQPTDPTTSEDQGRRRSLRERGLALLERSADVDTATHDVHPGFSRIVDQLSPDEARILRLLYRDGPQGIVYVNRAGPFGFGAREVARRLSLIGAEAGCVNPDLVPAYIDNLVRLGLTAIRRDPVGGEDLYQVIEAQPEVVAAMKKAGSGLFRGQTTRRGLHLSEFGHSFCDVCLSEDPDA